MAWTFCIQTDPGLLRKNNEDAVMMDTASGLAVLADGMGGYNAGEVASAIATTALLNELGPQLLRLGSQALSVDITTAMRRSVKLVNQSILAAARANPAYHGMGTTLVVGVFQGYRLTLGHIGDSRCYRLRAHKITQLTKDHSVLQAKIDAGLLTVSQAANSREKNLLTRALGVDSACELEVVTHEVLPGDLYLMCSDGLTDMLQDQDISVTLDLALSLEERARRLVAQANNNGGRDNITVLLAQEETGLNV